MNEDSIQVGTEGGGQGQMALGTTVEGGWGGLKSLGLECWGLWYP